MKLQQLRYTLEVYKHNLNVSEAAEALFTSQPGISKQIRLLEDELGIQIFIRNGKRVVSVSEPGKQVLQVAERMLRDAQNIKRIGAEFSEQDAGSLTIATTHTQARYVLPKIIAEFVARFPKVQLSIKQGPPNADFAIATEEIDDYPELSKLPCYQWNRSVVVPDGHPLLDLDRPLRIADIAQYPLVTYEFAFTGQSQIARGFIRAGSPPPHVALSAVDTDVIKTYVRLGLGVGLIASMAFLPDEDKGLHLINAEHLFEPSTTQIALRQDSYLRGFAYDFIQLFEPSLSRERISQILFAPINEDFSI
ncbi:MAG TPA: CysB family HTH-type transcriptional regulator [Vitreoscilla sp.]|nr:CysB family HTH-type transcriptional regulator [Vitreoscilla sp.]